MIQKTIILVTAASLGTGKIYWNLLVVFLARLLPDGVPRNKNELNNWNPIILIDLLKSVSASLISTGSDCLVAIRICGVSMLKVI